MLPRIGFFLGSGVSRPAAPGTEELTSEVVGNVGQYYLHTDEDWYVRPETQIVVSPEREQRHAQVAALIPALAARVDRYYEQRESPQGCVVRACNYEDIGYLADGLASTLNRKRDDPGLMPLAVELQRDLLCSADALHQAADDTVTFIRAVVFKKLIIAKPPSNHLRLVLDAARDPAIARMPIFTLNHDCLIEDAFAAAQVPLFDFRRHDGQGRVLLDLDATVPEEARAKPHGSVRWRRFRPLREPLGVDPWFTEWIGWDSDADGRRHDDGSEWRSIGGPLFLLGRFNKELEYIDAPYLQTMIALERSLRNVDRLVIGGYGFGDKAINTLLLNWLYEKPPGARRFVVMHQNESNLVDGARGAIAHKWAAWKSGGQLVVVPHFPCDYAWYDLKPLIQ